MKGGKEVARQYITMSVRPEASASLNAQVEYWRSYVHEEHAMAPTKRRLEVGGITTEEYEAESERFRLMDREVMLLCLNFLRIKNPSSYTYMPICHFGVGHGDDLVGYVPQAIKMGFNLKVYDILDPNYFTRMHTLMQKAYLEHELLSPLYSPEGLVEFGDIQAEAEDPGFNQEEVLAVKAGRLVYHYASAESQKLLRNLGKVARASGRLIILVHHDPEKNPGYEYKTSYPIGIKELMEPIRETAPKAQILLARDHRYFNYQTLTWLVIGQPEGWGSQG